MENKQSSSEWVIQQSTIFEPPTQSSAMTSEHECHLLCCVPRSKPLCLPFTLVFDDFNQLSHSSLTVTLFVDYCSEFAFCFFGARNDHILDIVILLSWLDLQAHTVIATCHSQGSYTLTISHLSYIFLSRWEHNLQKNFQGFFNII